MTKRNAIARSSTVSAAILAQALIYNPAAETKEAQETHFQQKRLDQASPRNPLHSLHCSSELNHVAFRSFIQVQYIHVVFVAWMLAYPGFILEIHAYCGIKKIFPLQLCLTVCSMSSV